MKIDSLLIIICASVVFTSGTSVKKRYVAKTAQSKPVVVDFIAYDSLRHSTYLIELNPSDTTTIAVLDSIIAALPQSYTNNVIEGSTSIHPSTHLSLTSESTAIPSPIRCLAQPQIQLSEEQFIDRLLVELELDKNLVIKSLIRIRSMPHDESKSVVLIPKRDTLEQRYDLFDLYILVVDNQSAEIKNRYYEPGVWSSDAVELQDVCIDFAHYKLNKQTCAFGIMTKYMGSSRATPYRNAELSLFVAQHDTLVKVLQKFEMSSFSGERNENCDSHYIETSTVLIMSSKVTNGYLDIIAKTQIMRTQYYWDKGECLTSDTIEHKTEILKFDGNRYK